MSNPDMIESAVDAAGLHALGYSAHLRARHGCMVIYTSEKYEAAVKVYLIEGGIRADVYTLLPQSMMKLCIDSISFPHPNLMHFINQIERATYAWKQQEGIA